MLAGTLWMPWLDPHGYSRSIEHGGEREWPDRGSADRQDRHRTIRRRPKPGLPVGDLVVRSQTVAAMERADLHCGRHCRADAYRHACASGGDLVAVVVVT